MSDLPFEIDEEKERKPEPEMLASNVLVVDDEPVVRDVFKRLMAREPGMSVSVPGEAGGQVRRVRARHARRRRRDGDGGGQRPDGRHALAGGGGLPARAPRLAAGPGGGRGGDRDGRAVRLAPAGGEADAAHAGRG